MSSLFAAKENTQLLLKMNFLLGFLRICSHVGRLESKMIIRL
jgi:hypothetical protein